ncbi:hypothetical protein F2Q70_00020581 [Brassica cretica]|uniref:HTH myb-type domain-containing protein n=1 Tax=Brassica cretica TaxID=69181 RepID=A0A8S9GNH0_BRACR|nr:hypothetical protein F2Q70_00020581 [Brassica cretica]
MGRRPCCEKIGLKRGPWTIEEDHRLMNFILNNGIHCWRIVPKLAGLLRCGKSCRLRWINYLRPDLKRGGFTDAEEEPRLVRALGTNCNALGFDARRRGTAHHVIKCGTGCWALSPAQVKLSRVKWIAA